MRIMRISASASALLILGLISPTTSQVHRQNTARLLRSQLRRQSDGPEMPGALPGGRPMAQAGQINITAANSTPTITTNTSTQNVTNSSVSQQTGVTNTTAADTAAQTTSPANTPTQPQVANQQQEQQAVNATGTVQPRPQIPVPGPPGPRPGPPAVPINASGQAVNNTNMPSTNATTNATTPAPPAPEPTRAAPARFLDEFTMKGDPTHLTDLGDGKVEIKITPWSETISAVSNDKYTGGRLRFKAQSAARMPGVITAIYLSDGAGRTGDVNTATQDEIDFEFKGNVPDEVQSNVFLDGQEHLQLLQLGYDSAAAEHEYAFDWTDTYVRYYINGQMARQVDLARPLHPMQLHISVWTTTNGWPGLIMWGGYTDWHTRNMEPIVAKIQILEYPMGPDTIPTDLATAEAVQQQLDQQSNEPATPQKDQN